LRVAAYDFETIGSDESLGETIISLKKYKLISILILNKIINKKRVLKKLRNEG
jgi:hypothetical protein